ncbi:hypothetical protein ACWEVP_34540 [Amycolatopsis sp. NPDC003865]
MRKSDMEKPGPPHAITNEDYEKHRAGETVKTLCKETVLDSYGVEWVIRPTERGDRCTRCAELVNSATGS